MGSKETQRGSLRDRLIMSAALSGLMVAGYGRQAYAGSCIGAAGVYLCSGAATGGDLTQTLSGGPLIVTTDPIGFGISTTAGNAFTLTGTGGISFTDNYTSSISGAYSGIDARNTGEPKVTARTPGDRALRVLEDAPGSYAMLRLGAKSKKRKRTKS